MQPSTVVVFSRILEDLSYSSFWNLRAVTVDLKILPKLIFFHFDFAIKTYGIRVIHW